MSFKITFLHTPKPRQYNHKYIYYDPEKEAREEREIRVNKELGITDPDQPFRTSIKRGSFRKFEASPEVTHSDEVKAARRRSNLYLLLVLVVLLIITAVFYLI